MDIGQPIVAALEQERQPLVIEAEQVQERGVEIVDVDFVLDRPGSRNRQSRHNSARVLHAAAGHPDGEATRAVVATGEGVVFAGCDSPSSACDRIRAPQTTSVSSNMPR